MTSERILSPLSLGQFDAAFDALWPGASVFLVADENTLPLIDINTEGCRRLAVPAGQFIFPGAPVLEADYRHVQTLKRILSSTPNVIPIVIGSGTLNDLCKCACGELNRDYGVIATAASVDGYASDGAALVKEGIKQTIPCPAPVLIIGDPEILKTAPPEMTASGYADLAAKIPAGADWILADIINEDPIDTIVWKELQNPLRSRLTYPTSLVALFEGLNLSGLAMQYLKKSRPASGAEHMMSHIWEMEHYSYQGKSPSHGFKVAVGSVCTLKAMHWLMDRGLTQRDFEKALENPPLAAVRESIIPELFPFLEDRTFLYEVNQKVYGDPDRFGRRLEEIRREWDQVCFAWKEYLPSEKEFASMLSTAGSPSCPGDLGLTWTQCGMTVVQAQYLRDRYSILDLLNDMSLTSEFRISLEALD
jgi:glycerol-1-phosphate dehydrogenase [NAD(P)+]